MDDFLIIFKWVLCLGVAVMGIFIMLIEPSHSTLGVILALSGFILFALSLAQAHINTFE